MSMGSVDMVEEIVPYLEMDQIEIVSASCSGALDAPPALRRGAPPLFH
jgi:hypothetical protein